MQNLRFWLCSLLSLSLLGTSLPLSAQLPVPFFRQRVTDHPWELVTQIAFAEDGRMFVAEKAGKVFIVDDEIVQETPLIDISEEVMNSVDHGLLSLTLHPNFLKNGYFYLFYTVDQHHLRYFGTPDYDPNQTLLDVATIGRITRYTADPATNFTTVIPGSRTILLGDKPQNGFPILHRSHGVGSMIFGTDNSLLVSCGDGGTYDNPADLGSNPNTAYEEALELGIITPAEDVGAYRSQMLSSLSGKILRIDPATGQGLASNPFYDEVNPDATASKVWALGFRNPFRFLVQPGTGSHNIEDGDPGVLFVGDVGWAEWEEIDVITEGGMNFGWPIYEGLHKRWQYSMEPRPHREYPNPLYDANKCTEEFYRFHDLIDEATEDGSITFSNPCDENSLIPARIPTFVHARPMVAWANKNYNLFSQTAEVPGFDTDGNPSKIDLDGPNPPATGGGFTGSCAIGGVFIEGDGFPESFKGRYISIDYPHWIRLVDFDSSYQLTNTELFLQEDDNLFMVNLVENPHDGCLYYVDFKEPRGIKKICYGGNPRPESVIELDAQYGPSPHTVQFTGSNSFDPEGQPITYSWDFGDGSTSEEADPSHTFISSGVAPESFTATLTVTDSAGESQSSDIIISLNNTPPAVAFSSFEDGDLYAAGKVTHLPLLAEVSDAEHAYDDLRFAWRAYLQHNTHDHPEPVIRYPKGTITIAGEGCSEEEEFWYRVNLTVTDPEGLSTMVEGELFPYCGNVLSQFDTLLADPTNEVVRLSGQVNLVAETELIIERAMPMDQVFEPIGSTTLSAGQQSFNYTDVAPIKGENIYRIKAQSQPKLAEYSAEVSALFPKPPVGLAFPNPTTGQLNFQLLDEAATVHIKVFTHLGQLIHEVEVDNQSLANHIYTTEFQDRLPGMYIYQLIAGQEIQVGTFFLRKE